MILFEENRKYQKELYLLRDYNFENLSVKEIKALIDRYLGIYPSTYGIQSPTKFNTYLFYRVRLNIDRNIEDTNLIQTFSYPPASSCRVNGRANLKGKSVFYCSNCSGTSIMESKPKEGEIGYLSVWKGNSDRETRSCMVLPKDLNNENVFRIVADDIYSYVSKYNSSTDPILVERYEIALKFIADLFMYESEPYRITSIFSNEILYDQLNFDYLIYPSVINQYYSCNFAIHPNVVQNYLRFIKVIKFKVNSIANNIYSLSIGKVGELDGPRIKWRPPIKEEEDIFNLPFFT